MTSVIVLVLGMAVCFAALASIMMILAVSTDHWEKTEYDFNKLKALPSLVSNESYLDPGNGFYKLVTTSDQSNGTKTTYLRATYGGIWRICDQISGKFHVGLMFCSLFRSTLVMTLVLL